MGEGVQAVGHDGAGSDLYKNLFGCKFQLLIDPDTWKKQTTHLNEMAHGIGSVQVDVFASSSHSASSTKAVVEVTRQSRDGVTSAIFDLDTVSRRDNRPPTLSCTIRTRKPLPPRFI